VWTKSTSLNERLGLTELKVICAIAGKWEKPILQPSGCIPIRLNQSRKVKTIAIKWVTTKGRNTDHRDYLHQQSTRHACHTALQQTQHVWHSRQSPWCSACCDAVQAWAMFKRHNQIPKNFGQYWGQRSAYLASLSVTTPNITLRQWQINDYGSLVEWYR